jgi:hypothetical protein
MRGRAAAAFLLAAASLSSAPHARAEEAFEAPPSFVLARMPDEGQTAVSAFAGRPFESVWLDHAFLSFLDVGLAFDESSAGFFRLGGHLRLRALRLGDLELSVRLAVARVLPQANSGYGARAIARATDGELSLLASYAVFPRLALFAEGTVLGETDFGRPHTAAFLEVQGGAEWAVLGPFSVIGRYGVLKGARSSAAMGSAGVGFGF